MHALTFTMNYHQLRPWVIGHLWSLSVEEQFYLLWPAMLLLIGIRPSMWVAAAAIACAPIWRSLVWVIWPTWRSGIGETFPTVMDAIAVGCVLAGLQGWLARRKWYNRFLSSPAFLAVPVVVVYSNSLAAYPSIDLPLGMTVRNIGIALIVHWSIRQSSPMISRVLNTSLLQFVGRVSYSVYLWQQPFLNRHSRALLTAFPVNISCAFACAVLSFYIVETPALRLRARFDRRRGNTALIREPNATLKIAPS
jgi:peptidoglycan/LPS O-acetylase OafA/YrhL